MSDTLNTTPRRVLGSLAVNTPTTASKPRNPLSTSKKLAPLSPIGRVCSPPRVGQKRTIDQVEGPSPKSAARRDSPPQTEAREPSIHVYEDVQTIPEPVECTDPRPISTNTPSGPTRTSLPNSKDGDRQTTSQSTLKDSTSAVIDLDPDNESVSSFQTPPTEPPTPGQPIAKLRAETLRLRLRVAMFKINTHQTNIPLSRLQISPNKLVYPPSQDPISPSKDATTPQSALAPIAPTLSRLLPAPILIPTAYSARLVHDPPVPSSPPTSFGSAGSQGPPSPGLATPALPQQRRSHSPTRLYSPPGSQEKGAQEAYGFDPDANLPSSVIKGRAATGLLKLMTMG